MALSFIIDINGPFTSTQHKRPYKTLDKDATHALQFLTGALLGACLYLSDYIFMRIIIFSANEISPIE
jgi:hypothetical protein